MRHFLLIILVFGQVAFSYSQTIEQLKKNAIMLVHADLTDFSLTHEKSILDSVLNDYNISVLKQEGILECNFFSVNAKCVQCKECSFILAYSGQEKRFFRLQGFKYNEFTEFYNLVLLNGSVPGIQGKGKKAFKQIVSKVHIDKINLEKLYASYYKKYKNALFDGTSCYRQSLIREY